MSKEAMVMYTCQYCGKLITYCRYPCLYCGEFPTDFKDKAVAHTLSNAYLEHGDIMNIYIQRMAGKTLDKIIPNWPSLVSGAVDHFRKDEDFIAIDSKIPNFDKAMINERLNALDITCSNCNTLIDFGNQKVCSECNIDLMLTTQQRAIIGTDNFLSYLGKYSTLLGDLETTGLLIPLLVKVVNDLIENDTITVDLQNNIAELFCSVNEISADFMKISMLNGDSQSLSIGPEMPEALMKDTVEFMGSINDIKHYVVDAEFPTY